MARRTDHARAIRDYEWEHSLVERIRQGYAGPNVVAVRDLIDDDHPYYPVGWEAAEKNAACAVRTGAAYLDDRSIAKRVEKREALKRQMEEIKEAWRLFEEGKGSRPPWGDPRVKSHDDVRKQKTSEVRKAMAAARAEEQRAYIAKIKERARRLREER